MCQVVLYLELFSIEVLQVLLREDLVEAFKESLSLLLHPSGQPPLCYQPAGGGGGGAHTHVTLYFIKSETLQSGLQ